MDPIVRDLRLLAASLLLLASVLAACTEAPPPAPARLERVVRRLDAHAFPAAPSPRHGPVAQIGDEARAVVLAPEEVVAAEALGVVPSEGRMRVPIELAPEHAGLPQAAFVLTTQELPFTQPIEEAAMAKIARDNFFLRRDRGWRLLRDEAGRGVLLEIDHEGRDAVQVNVRLTALLPVPPVLESEPFDVPDEARMRLGFGLATSRERDDVSPVEFVATLSCPGTASRELVRRTLSLADETAGWVDAAVAIDGPRTECRLRLSNEPRDGGRPRGAVWAVPQILAPEPRGEDDTNLVLISLDTLRADHLSGLGYPRETTPVIDEELMARGTTFTDVSSTFPQTDVSHLSIFTGLYPSAQPTRGRVGASDRLVLLAERLQQAGLETAAFTEDALVSGAFGFWFGFDQFTERSFAHADRGRPTIDDGIRYLRRHRDRRFFLFLHTYKTHDPYVPSPKYESLWTDPEAWRDGGPAPWVPEKHRPTMDRYDRTIREADALVGELLQALEKEGLAGRTFVVVTSDHGEAFGEHGIAGHGFTPHQEALGVPLVVRGPGVPAGRRVETPASIADLAPTLLDLLRVPPATPTQGVSLVPAMRGGTLAAERPLFYSWLRPEAAGVRQGTGKYHRTANGAERFDLGADPREWAPDRDPAAHAEGERLLAEHEAQSAGLREGLGPEEPRKAEPPAPAIDERLEKSLEALGYL